MHAEEQCSRGKHRSHDKSGISNEGLSFRPGSKGRAENVRDSEKNAYKPGRV